jgi:hypothetical protein
MCDVKTLFILALILFAGTCVMIGEHLPFMQIPRTANSEHHKNVTPHRYVNTAEHLYTTQGHSHVPLDILQDNWLAPLTRWTQAEIFRHQNPLDCEKSKFLITDGWDSGFGSEMHVIGSHLAYAIQNNYILVWGSHSCRRFSHCTDASGCACLYKELSNCSSGVDLSQWNKVSHCEYGDVVPNVFREAMLLSFPSMTGSELKYWWRAQSVGYLMRLNDNTVSELYAMRMDPGLHYMSGDASVPFPLPPGTVNSHIRHGDKSVEMNLVPSENYIEAFVSMIHNMPNSFSRILFVSSDDESAVDVCRNLTEKLKMKFIYTKLTRMEGGHHMSLWDSQNSRMQRGLVLGHFLQLLMALEADAWIGTRGSNWNRLIDELRCVWVDKCHHIYSEVGSTEPNEPYNW